MAKAKTGGDKPKKPATPSMKLRVLTSKAYFGEDRLAGDVFTVRGKSNIITARGFIDGGFIEEAVE